MSGDDNTPPPRTASTVRREFEAAASAHEWLRAEVARFMFPDRSMDEAFAGAVEHLATAVVALDELSAGQYKLGELIGFELRIGSPENSRRAFLRDLPTPSALLLLCCERAEPGDPVVVRHIIAHEDIIEMRSFWPFPMDVAVSMVSPSATELLPPTPPKRRQRFRRS